MKTNALRMLGVCLLSLILCSSAFQSKRVYEIKLNARIGNCQKTFIYNIEARTKQEALKIANTQAIYETQVKTLYVKDKR